MTNPTISEGQTVYDKRTPSYTVIERLDCIAKNCVALEKRMDRGHVIDRERTVAELNPSYPETDTVVKLQNNQTGNEVLWPESRVTTTKNEI